MARRQKSGQYTQYPGDVREDFSDLSGIANLAPTEGEVSLDTSIVLAEDASMKLTVYAGKAAATAREATITPARDFSDVNSNEYIGCWIYFPRDCGIGTANIDDPYIYLCSDNTALTNYYWIKGSSFVQSAGRSKGWHFIGAPKSEWTAVNSPDWSAIRSIRYVLKNNSGAEATVYFDSLISSPKMLAQCMLSFDDGFAVVHDTAFPILQAEGLVATNYVTQDKISDLGGVGMSLANMATLAAAGWSNANHYTTHVSVAVVSLDVARTMIGDAQDYFNSLGYDGDHVAYTGGGRTTQVVEMIREELGIKTARLADTTYTAPLFAHRSGSLDAEATDLFQIPCYELGYTVSLATAKGWVDDACANKKTICIYGHGLVTTPTTANEWAIADYTALAAHIKLKVNQGLLECPTIKQWYDGRGGVVR